MTTAIQIIGIVIIIALLPITIWFVTLKKPYLRTLIFCVDPIFFIFGVILFKIDLIYEITLPEGTTIKTTLQKATLEAKEVSVIKERVEAQSATIDLVAKSASEAKNLSIEAKSLYEELSNKNKIADKELKNISDKILPLELKADSLSTLTKKTRKEVLRMQERLNIQKLMVASIAGSRTDYEKLNKVAGKKSRIQTYANSALRYIFFYFMSEKFLTAYPILVDPISNKSLDYPVDEVIFIYHNDKRDMQEACVNTLFDLNRETAVQELCDAIDKEQNLRVISRMTRTLEKLTGKYFDPLDINAVKKWWEENRGHEKYKPCYKGLLEVCALQQRQSFGSDKNDYKQAVSLLKQTIDADPDALYSRCFLGYYHTLLKEFENAETEFNEVENRSKNNYHWLFYFKALLFLSKNNDVNSAVISLNRAMEISPQVETFIISSSVFKNLLKNPQLKFPSNKKSE